jgi:translation initiation factor IF-2
VRAERDEAVILVTGRIGDRVEWSIGEALVGVNYRVSGKQAAYVYAMAEKRAKDRVILKLIELHGLVYSEEEADEFKNGRPAQSEAAAPEAQAEAAPETTRVELVEAESEIEAQLKKKIDKAKSINAVTDLMLHADTQKSLNALSPALRDEVRDYAKAKLMALGWPGKKAA